MKKIFILVLTAVSSLSFGQIAIGKTAVSSPDAILDFGTGNKGIILPWVTSAADVVTAGVVPGTLILDTSDGRVKLRTNSVWRDLSQKGDPVDASSQNEFTEQANAKVIFGANQSDTTPGILVLTDANKAMVLPKMVSPHLNIKNPAAGMMAYDTLKHQLVVFNGTVWTFWKP